MSGIICPHCGQMHREGAKFCATTGKLISSQPLIHTGAQPDAAPKAAHLQAGLTGRLPPNSFLRNRYLILRKIGQGGMAAVYQAADTSQPGTQWAIKEMSDAALSASDREYAVQAFLQEGNLLRSLNHPNLPRVIDVFTEGGKHYLVMEFIPGQTLQELLEERTQPFSQSEVVPWAVQLCNALAYLHTQNPRIIFRDLKPSNIMLTLQGPAAPQAPGAPQSAIKLIDFGIVRFFKPGKTRDTMALGTPGYAAQEAIAGQTDERSDLYSLCVTLHQLLTLNDPARTMFHHPPARQLNPAIAPELERILERGMQNQRELRWGSAAELSAELARFGGQSGLLNAAALAYVAPIQPGGVNRAAASAQPQPGQPPAASYGGQAPVATASASPAAAGPSLSTSRPTTRLIAAAAQVAAQFSGRQLAALAAGAVVFLVVATLLLAPLMRSIGFDWNNIPIIAIFGALGYTIYPRPGSAFASHALLSAILTITVWLRLGDQGYTWLGLALATLISGAFVEIWVAFLPKVISVSGGDRGADEGWLREAAWMAGMAVIATALFFGLVTNWITGWKPAQLLISAVFGLIGWFLGDMLKQYLLFRKTGLRKF